MKLFCSLLLSALVLVFPLTVLSADSPLLIFGDSSEPPKSYVDLQGKPAGEIVDVVRFIAKESGLDLEIQLHPWKRAYQNALNGKGLIMSLSKTTEREIVFDYTDVIYFDELVLVTHNDRIKNFSTLEDLKGKTIALNLGASYGDKIDKAIETGLFKTVRINNRESWYQMLLRGRVDGVIASQGRQGVDLVLSQSPKLSKRRHEFKVFDQPLKKDPNYIGIPKSISSPALLDRLNAAITVYWESKKQ